MSMKAKKKPADTSGFDFLKLSKAQWAHLKLIEREHGIPWYIYIRDLIKADMEGRLLSPNVRERRKKLKADITPDRLENVLKKIEEIFNRPQQVVYTAPGAPQPPPNIDSDTPLVKPSEGAVKFKYTNPSELADGSSVSSHKDELMAELRTRIGVPKVDKAVKIEFPSHVEETANE